MGKFVFAYRGGTVAEDPAEREQVMAAWGTWLGQLGEALVDGGAPFGASSTVSGNGTVNGGGSAALGGYSIVSADSLEAAVAHAKSCPELAAGGTVDVYEALPI